MKTVFSSSEVAHVWAQQNQGEGRNAGGTFYFSGPTIFSYGSHFPVATFADPSAVLFTTKKYSNSTSRHISHAHRALREGVKVFYVPDVPYNASDLHAALIKNAEAYLKEFPILQLQVLRSRTNGEWRREALEKRIKEASDYADKFRKPIGRKLFSELKKWNKLVGDGALFSEDQKKQLAEIIKRDKEAKKKLEAKWAKEAEERRAKALASFEEWKRGVNTGLLYYDLPVALRINGEEIQTSRGAAIPLIEARKFWHALQRREDVTGMRLGHYTVDSLDGATLTVGCHEIPLREVLQMAKALKWDDGTTLAEEK